MPLLTLLVENLEAVTRIASIGVASIGALGLFLVLCCWSWIENYYREFIAKVAVAIFRAIAAAAAIISKWLPPVEGGALDQPWAMTIGIAILGYLLWEIVGAVGDHKFKQAKEINAAKHWQEIETLRQDMEDAELEAKRLNWLITHLRELVNWKTQRVRRVAQQSVGTRASIQQARDGLGPDEQIPMILEALASLFRTEVISTGGSLRQNFRVGLFVEKDGVLRPRDAFDLATKRHDPFTSPDTHADRFRLDNMANPSHAVRCVLEGQTLIVSDCENSSSFQYFEEKQRSYLRSLVAYPLTDCCPDGTGRVRAALLVDTDESGYFREEDREMIESQIKEFVVRIDLEYAISGLIARP